MPRQSVFSYTNPHGQVPDYISVNTAEHPETDDRVEVTVRQHGATTVVWLGRVQIAELAKALKVHLSATERDCPHAAPHRFCSSCPVSPCAIGLGHQQKG